MGEFLILAFLVWLGYLMLRQKATPSEIEIPVKITFTTEYRTAGGDSISVDDIEADGSDAWEPFDYYKAVEIPAAGQFKIRYTDSSGLTTEREIIVKRVQHANGEYMIAAQCLLRGAHRSFLNSRIEHATDTATGEIIENVAEHAIKNHELSPAGMAEELFIREELALSALIYVARADGRMLKPERAIIGDYLKQQHPDISIDDGDLEKEIKKLYAPDSVNELRRVIKRLSADQQQLGRVLEASRKIVATQKTIDPVEQLALDMMAAAVLPRDAAA